MAKKKAKTNKIFLIRNINNGKYLNYVCINLKGSPIFKEAGKNRARCFHNYLDINKMLYFELEDNKPYWNSIKEYENLEEDIINKIRKKMINNY